MEKENQQQYNQYNKARDIFKILAKSISEVHCGKDYNEECKVRSGAFGNLIYGGMRTGYFDCDEDVEFDSLQYHLMDRKNNQYLGSLINRTKVKQYKNWDEHSFRYDYNKEAEHILAIKTPNCGDMDVVDTCYEGKTEEAMYDRFIPITTLNSLHIIHSQKENPDEFLNNLCAVINKNITIQAKFADEELSKFNFHGDILDFIADVRNKQTTNTKLSKLDISSKKVEITEQTK